MQDQNTANQQRLSFQQKPIGKGQPIPELSQYPPDFNPDDIEMVSKPQPLPLPKRIQSKVWKTRKQAFQQLLQQVKQNHVNYKQFEMHTIKFITDANIMCQEKALKIVLFYLQKNNQINCEIKTLAKTLIEKCLIIQKGQVKQLATQILFWMMDNHGKQAMLNQVNQAILNKNPKIVASSLLFLQKLVNNYGAKKLQGLQRFSKHFTLLADSVRAVAKKESVQLFKQVYKWMGESTFGLAMHQQVKDQVNKFGKTHKLEPMQVKRGLNEDQKKGKKTCLETMEQQESDEPQDVLGHYDGRWVDKVLQLTKWKQKKSMLDEFIKKTNVSNIVNRQNSHFITLIKRLLSDNNINLLQCGFKVVKNLCRGLKKNFNHPTKVIQSLAFSKLKDSKAMIIDQAQQTLQKMLFSITLQDLIEDIKEGLKDKAPNMRLQVRKFVQTTLKKQKKNNKDKKVMGAMKVLLPTFIQLHQDGASQVRDKSIDILCKIKSKYGINFLGDKLKKLPTKKLSTIQNYTDPEDQEQQQQMDIEQNNHNSIDIEYNTNNISAPKSVTPYNAANKNIKNTYNPKQILKQSKMTVSSQPNARKLPVSEFQSPNETVRMNAYQNLLNKNGYVINLQLIGAFKQKVPMYRQSNPQILKVILSLVRKSANTLTPDHIELILYHDWKKCKSLLIQFIQHNKISLAGLEMLKNNGIMGNTAGNKKQNYGHSNGTISNTSSITNLTNTNTHQNNSTLKYFYQQIQSLLPKMSNPNHQVRLEAADCVLKLLEQIPVGVALLSENQITPDCLNHFYNVLKCRIQDNNITTVNKYIKVITQLLNKGFLSKSKSASRQIIPILLQKLSDPNLLQLQVFIKQMASNHSTLLWQLLAPQIIKQNMCTSVLSIIRNYNQSFFKYADHKSYILPLLTCLNKSLEIQKSTELLDQIIEIYGKDALEKVVKQNGANFFNSPYGWNKNIQYCLKKWDINVNVENKEMEQNKYSNQYAHNNRNNMMNTPFTSNRNTGFMSKEQRINSQISSPWPLIPESQHIYKLISEFLSMGPPFTQLASFVGLKQDQLAIVSELQPTFIENYSDLLIKWIYWRINIQKRTKSLMTILHLAKRLVTSNFQLHESEIIVLMGALSSCLSLHKSEYLNQIIHVNSLLAQQPIYKEKAFRFWINSFNDSDAPADQILKTITQCFSDVLATELVALARYPSVVRNKQFNQYLKSNYSEKILTVYGFKFVNKNLPSKVCNFRSASAIVENALRQEQTKIFLDFFQKSSSNQVINKIIQYINQSQFIGNPENKIIQTHLKIIWSIITPYLNRQLPFINVYNYFKYLQTVIQQVDISSHLLNLMKTFAYFLIDIDECRLQNYEEMLKTVNKLILILLENKHTQHVLQVLFILFRQQLKCVQPSKLNLLLPKCISKVLKNPTFRQQFQRNPESKQTLIYVIQQIVMILNQFEIASQSPTMKTIRMMLNDLITLYGIYVMPHFINIVENGVLHHESARNVLNQLIQEIYNKQNTMKQRDPPLGLQNNKVPNPENYEYGKNIKNMGNMMKAMSGITNSKQGISTFKNSSQERQDFINRQVKG